MSYICANCHVSQLPRTPAIPIVTETRKVQYLNHVLVREGDDEGTVKEVVSKGTEIVREVRVCPPCAVLIQQAQEQDHARQQIAKDAGRIFIR